MNMDFERKQQEQTTTAEKTVTREQYKKAVTKAIEQAAKDPKLEGMSSLIYAMSGASFASEVEIILFGKSEG